MKKYGVHWPRFTAGYFLSVTPVMFWVAQMIDAFWHASPGAYGAFHGPSFYSQAIVQFAMFVLASRAKTKAAEDAANAPEEKPTVVAPNTRRPNANVPLTRAQRQRLFGILSAIVAVVTLAAHFYNPVVTLVHVLLYPLLLPFAVTLGNYLVQHAQQPEPIRPTPQPLPLSHTPQTAPQPTQVAPSPTDTPHQLTLSQKP